MYSARSVDSRGFFRFSMMVLQGTPLRPVRCEIKLRHGTFDYDMVLFQNFISHLADLGRVPYHHGKTEKTSGINRSRAVHIPRYSQKNLTPKTQKVTAVQSWTKVRDCFFKKKENPGICLTEIRQIRLQVTKQLKHANIVIVYCGRSTHELFFRRLDTACSTTE